MTQTIEEVLISYFKGDPIWSGNKLKRIGKLEVEYSNNRVCSVGGLEIEYTGNRLYRVNRQMVSYSGDKVSYIGDVVIRTR